MASCDYCAAWTDETRTLGHHKAPSPASIFSAPFVHKISFPSLSGALHEYPTPSSECKSASGLNDLRGTFLGACQSNNPKYLRSNDFHHMTADLVRARPPTSNLELPVASPASNRPRQPRSRPIQTYGTHPLNVEVFLPPIHRQDEARQVSPIPSYSLLFLLPPPPRPLPPSPLHRLC